MPLVGLERFLQKTNARQATSAESRRRPAVGCARVSLDRLVMRWVPGMRGAAGIFVDGCRFTLSVLSVLPLSKPLRHDEVFGRAAIGLGDQFEHVDPRDVDIFLFDQGRERLG